MAMPSTAKLFADPVQWASPALTKNGIGLDASEQMHEPFCSAHRIAVVSARYVGRLSLPPACAVDKTCQLCRVISGHCVEGHSYSAWKSPSIVTGRPPRECPPLRSSVHRGSNLGGYRARKQAGSQNDAQEETDLKVAEIGRVHPELRCTAPSYGIFG